MSGWNVMSAAAEITVPVSMSHRELRKSSLKSSANMSENVLFTK